MEHLHRTDITDTRILSLNRFVLLSVLSFNLYLIWWSYKKWRFFNQKDKLGINPALRTIFAVFFIQPLFREILKYAKGYGYRGAYSSVLLFIVFFILSILSYSPVYSSLSLVGFLVFLPPVKALNFAMLADNTFVAIQNPKLSYGEIAILSMGSLIWLFVIWTIVIN